MNELCVHNQDKPAVRAQAFMLFGNLSRFGDGPSRTPFLEQIHSNIVSLLLHLNDVDPEVRKVCALFHNCSFVFRSILVFGPKKTKTKLNSMMYNFKYN